ncbi:hypothetical protein MHYP_G00348450 [Metynnis hypsauchen]
MPAKKAVTAQKESATEENRQASSFADSSTTGATGTATDIERVCELLQTFMSEQRSKDESIQREMARQEQRWRSLQHQFGLLQREVQKGQFMAETSDTREEEQERQTQTRILRSSQSAVLTQPQQPEQLPAQMARLLKQVAPPLVSHQDHLHSCCQFHPEVHPQPLPAAAKALK